MHTPGFAQRLATYRESLDRPAMSSHEVDALQQRLAHPDPASREAALRDALRIGAPAYQAFRSLTNASLDVETRRFVGIIVRRLAPLARLVKKRRLHPSLKTPSGRVPKGARLVKSSECGSLWLIHHGQKRPVASLASVGSFKGRVKIVSAATLARLPDGSLQR